MIRLYKNVNDVKKRRKKDFNVTINYDKCIENTSQLQFLGFVFGKEGIIPNEKLIERIDKFPTPKNNKKIASFLGIANYYGRFIDNFASISSPLNDLKTKKLLVGNKIMKLHLRH